jgi:hypothetical protein
MEAGAKGRCAASLFGAGVYEAALLAVQSLLMIA